MTAAITKLDAEVAALNLASYAGSWIGGSAVGYVVGKSGRSAVTGGLTTSGIWSLTTGVANIRTFNPLTTASFVGLGALSLYLAWKR